MEREDGGANNKHSIGSREAGIRDNILYTH